MININHLPITRNKATYNRKHMYMLNICIIKSASANKNTPFTSEEAKSCPNMPVLKKHFN